MAVTYAFYSGTTFKIPVDCNRITIECVGAGSTNGNGGAYSKTNSISVTPGSTIYFQIGSFGGDTWVNVTGNSVPANTSTGCLAIGGSISPSSQIASGVGNLKFRGGNPGGFAGGGAAGPGGNGGDGSFVSPNYIGGGANNGGSSVSSSNIDASVVGLLSQFGKDYLSISYGSYGGATAWNNGDGPTQGMGGGGNVQTSASTPGIGAVYISFVPVPKAGTYQELLTTIGAGVFRIPQGTTQITFEGIGAGSNGNNTFPHNGGGGGAYARGTFNFNKDQKYRLAWYNIPGGQTYNTALPSHTWINMCSNSSSLNSLQGIFASSAYTSNGGFSYNSVGQITGSGGYGGGGSSLTSSTTRKGGGGGGAAFGNTTTGFSGGNGGNASAPTSSAGGAGGGGGGAATYYSSGYSAGNGGTATGGAGGSAGSGGGSGGAGGTSTAGNTCGKVGSSGGGGGGSGYRASTVLYGAVGSPYAPPFWPTGAGPGGGGGGGGSNTTSSSGTGGQGAQYGGGGGSGDSPASGGQGVILITYTVKVNGSLLSFFI